jgi:hypothetical protein
MSMQPGRPPLPSGLAIAVMAIASWAAPATGQVLVEGDWGPGLVVEPFAGSIDFADELFLDQQAVAGALGGIKLGRDVGLLGYYWRGVTDEFDRVEGIESWGGEIQLDIHLGGPVKPYLLGGAGRLVFREDFLDPENRERDDQSVLILGAGLAWDVNRWLRLEGSARNYLMEPPSFPVIEPLASGNDLVSSWMISGGIALRLGGQPQRVQAGGAAGGPAGAIAAGDVAVVPVPETGEIRVTYGAGAVTGALATGGPAVLITPEGDTILVAGAAASAAAVQRLLATELGYLDAIFPESTSLEGGREPITGERADTLERRMAARFNEAFDYLMAVETEAIRLALYQQLNAEGVGQEATDRVMARADTVLDARLGLIAGHRVTVDAEQDQARRLFELRRSRRRFAAPYAGANFSNGGQFVLGGRLGLNTTWQQDRWSWVPEVALGFGAGGVTTVVQGGLHYFFPTNGAVEFYGGLSAGVLVMSEPIGDRSGADFVLTPVVGITGESTEIAAGLGGGAWGWFAEFQGIGFFDLNRVLVGLRWAY